MGVCTTGRGTSPSLRVPRDRLGAVDRPERSEHLVDMALHGCHGHEQPVRDLGIGQSERHELEHLGLAFGQPVARTLGGGSALRAARIDSGRLEQFDEVTGLWGQVGHQGGDRSLLCCCAPTDLQDGVRRSKRVREDANRRKRVRVLDAQVEQGDDGSIDRDRCTHRSVARLAGHPPFDDGVGERQRQDVDRAGGQPERTEHVDLHRGGTPRDHTLSLTRARTAKGVGRQASTSGQTRAVRSSRF